MNWSWRDYQNLCFQSIFQGLRDGITRQLIVQATGLGKRIQAVWIARIARRSLFLAHTEELIDQAYRDFARVYGANNVGIIRGKRMDLDKPFVISSPQTLINRLHLIPRDHFSLLQIDEVHRYMARTFYEVVNYFQVKLRLGWTATPRRLDGLSLMDMFDTTIFEYGILQGIRDNHLAELDGIQIKTNVNLDKVGRVGGDFNMGQLERAVDIPARNMLIVNSYLKYARNRPFIGFCVDTQHMIHLGEFFEDQGINVGLISSKKEVCPDRKGTIERFTNRELQGLLNVDILTEGFDYPDVGAVLWGKPTQSETKFFQGIGRGTRKKSNWFKSLFNAEDCKVLDFVDITSKHKLVNTYEIDKKSSAADKIFVNTEKRDKILEAEESRKNSQVMGDIDKDRRVDLTEPPKIEVSTSEKMMEEATPAQIKMLERFGLYDTHDSEGNAIIYTKRMVSDILNTAEAFQWMQRKLLHWGYNPNGATLAQYLHISRQKQNESKKQSREEEIKRQNEELRRKLQQQTN